MRKSDGGSQSSTFLVTYSVKLQERRRDAPQRRIADVLALGRQMDRYRCRRVRRDRHRARPWDRGVRIRAVPPIVLAMGISRTSAFSAAKGSLAVEAPNEKGAQRRPGPRAPFPPSPPRKEVESVSVLCGRPGTWQDGIEPEHAGARLRIKASRTAPRSPDPPGLSQNYARKQWNLPPLQRGFFRGSGKGKRRVARYPRRSPPRPCRVRYPSGAAAFCRSATHTSLRNSSATVGARGMGPGNGSQLGNFVAAFLLVLVGYLYGDERGIEKPRSERP
jgi:hypothetical protein